MRLIAGLALLLVGVSGSLTTLLPKSPAQPAAAALAHSLSVSPLPGVYSGDGAIEDYRVRLTLSLRGTDEPTRLVLSASRIRKLAPDLISRRAIVRPLLSWVLNEETDSDRESIRRMLCRWDEPLSGFVLLAWDAGGPAIDPVREEEFSCAL